MSLFRHNEIISSNSPLILGWAESLDTMTPSPTLAPILHSRLPASSTLAAQDPVWLLVRLAVTPHTHAEQDIAICSTKQIAIYNAVCMMDKLTNRQFRYPWWRGRGDKYRGAEGVNDVNLVRNRKCFLSDSCRAGWRFTGIVRTDC